ncbi:MAG: hypothetical protein UV05_C0011G0007 [candidate division CPR1 bacterium GW2011_GWA2_42_17]|uniref:Uncharacterized protein n=1 Tax=candidate division CPR1 bacterium GW2011_GWA2_42_17 TaxID=1618341 RepID=A0A0G1BCP9_9BACT|nr:MAG: hypothetical protein UV05_C0011G0007 [candidate division CPR1 bacterium GW2011_GWA2_42_17]
MAKRRDSVFDDGRPLSKNEGLHVIFLILITIDILLGSRFPEFWYHFIGFFCFLGAAIVVFLIIKENLFPAARNRYRFLFTLYTICCLAAITSILVDIKVMETIANFLATFQ